jgi:hypothetical protein
MISREAIEQIEATAIKAAGIVIHEVPGDLRHVIIAANGDFTEREIPPAQIRHTVEAVEDLVRFAKTVTTCLSVWHDVGRIVLVLDESDRLDTVTVMLQESDQCALLKRLRDSRQWMTQADFVRMLAIELDVDRGLVGAFRTLDFHRRQGGAVDIQHGKESLGHRVEAAVQGVNSLPEELTINAPLFANLHERKFYPVRCAVEINPQEALFRLSPLAGQIETAMQAHQQDIHRRLSEGLAGCDAIYYGTP